MTTHSITTLTAIATEAL